LLKKYEGVDPLEILPPALPDTAITFESNKQYVREILESQYDLRTDGLGYARLADLPDTHRYFQFQRTVNAGGVPSEQVVDEDRAERDRDYRDETEGDNPIPELRQIVAA